MDIGPWIVPIVRSLALAAVTAGVGLFVIARIMRVLERILERSRVDKTLQPFLCSVLSVTLKVLLAISVIRILGIDTTSFVAVLAATGFAVGLAFQGSLSNFAGGVLLLTLRPFEVGNYVEAGGHAGTVQSIGILYTELATPNNVVIYMPNGSLANGSIVNYSARHTRRADFQFGVGYEQDTEHVKRVLREIADNHPRVLPDPEPFVRMSEHGDSSIVFTMRVWAESEHYWGMYFDIIEEVKKRFDQENISIPYPQRDLHIHRS